MCEGNSGGRHSLFSGTPVAAGNGFANQYGPPLHHRSMAIETLNLPVRGMTCANCARSVERTLGGMPGVMKALVELQGERAIVEYDPERVTHETLVQAVRDLGYEVPA